MKPELILGLALVLGGGLAGCSTAYQPAAQRPTDLAPRYLYWGSERYGSACRYLSTQIYPGEAINVAGNDFMDLRGQIEWRGTNFIADLMGSTGGQSEFYRGEMTLEKAFFGQGGAASGGVVPSWFLISTNSGWRTILARVNAARGWTGAPFYHPDQPAATLPSPVVRSLPMPLDPATGLPWAVDPTTGRPQGNSTVDPKTGLLMPPKQDKP